MQPEGRALPGLDEFMLRLGHLTVLCQAAVENGGSAHRFEREAVERFTRLVQVPTESLSDVAAYLLAKRLCPTADQRASLDFDESEFRYPEIVIKCPSELCTVEPWRPNGRVEIFWQDLCLAANGVPSRVGSITTNAKRGSKTGISHVIDWASMLDLVSSSGAPFVTAQLVAKFNSPAGRSANPYLLGNERLVFAFQILKSDFDVFSALAVSLSARAAALGKKEATEEYVRVVESIADAAERTKSISQRQRHNLFSLWKDLRRSGRNSIIASTAWHRAASRFETYVDLGFLRKGDSGEQERYAYKYHVTPRLQEIVRSLKSSKDAEAWLDDHLVNCVLGLKSSDETIEPEELLKFLPLVVEPLARPTSPLPIETLMLGLAWLFADLNRAVTLGAARRSIEGLAIKRPDIARLSTGTKSRAEYISLFLGGSKHGRDAETNSV